MPKKTIYHQGQQWNAYTSIYNKKGSRTAQVLFLKII